MAVDNNDFGLSSTIDPLEPHGAQFPTQPQVDLGIQIADEQVEEQKARKRAMRGQILTALAQGLASYASRDPGRTAAEFVQQNQRQSLAREELKERRGQRALDREATRENLRIQERGAKERQVTGIEAEIAGQQVRTDAEVAAAELRREFDRETQRLNFAQDRNMAEVSQSHAARMQGRSITAQQELALDTRMMELRQNAFADGISKGMETQDASMWADLHTNYALSGDTSNMSEEQLLRSDILIRTENLKALEDKKRVAEALVLQAAGDTASMAADALSSLPPGDPQSRPIGQTLRDAASRSGQILEGRSNAMQGPMSKPETQQFIHQIDAEIEVNRERSGTVPSETWARMYSGMKARQFTDDTIRSAMEQNGAPEGIINALLDPFMNRGRDGREQLDR
jgi:hypothetical protein